MPKNKLIFLEVRQVCFPCGHFVFKRQLNENNDYSEEFEGSGFKKRIRAEEEYYDRPGIESFNFNRWKREYNFPVGPEAMIVDGAKGEISYQYEGEGIKRIRFNNYFPSNWERLLRTLDIGRCW